MCVAVGAAGIAAAGSLGAAALGGGGSGGGGGNVAPSSSNVQTVYNPQSLGQTLTGILSGGVSAGLGISGLAGGNANQLQAGALAANPFGQYASGFVPELQQLLQGGLASQINNTTGNEQNLLNNIIGPQYINTNTGALSGAANISTPGATNALTSLTQNGASLPSSISSIIAQNPYSFTSGEQFQYQQGMNAVNATAAAQGLVGSGNQLTQLEQYGQNYANQAVQQNITNLLGAQSASTAALGQQTQTASSLGQLQSQQQQNTFGNLLGIQQLQTTQQQGTAGNLLNLLSAQTGIGAQNITAYEGLLSPLLTATQASLSSPATAGGILANLGVANQVSAGNLGSGLGGLANGLGNLASGLSGLGGSNNFTGDFSGSGTYTSGGDYNSLLYGPSGYGSGYSYSGDNSYGFTI